MVKELSEQEKKDRAYKHMTSREIIQAKAMFSLGDSLEDIAEALGRDSSTIKRAIDGNEHLNIYVRNAEMELQEELQDEVKTIIKSKEAKELEVKSTILDEAAALILAKIRRHPESIGVKELSGAMKDIFGIVQVEQGKPSEITKLEDADPHALASILRKLEGQREQPADEPAG